MTDTPLSELVMQLDSSLPKTHSVPIHPDTKELWKERGARLYWLEMMLRYEEEPDPAWRVELKTLLEETEFREEPLFMEQHVLLGAAFAGAKIPRTFRCHPETWEALPEEQKTKYELVPETNWKISFDDPRLGSTRKFRITTPDN
jgi:hypothetical protein